MKSKHNNILAFLVGNANKKTEEEKEKEEEEEIGCRSKHNILAFLVGNTNKKTEEEKEKEEEEEIDRVQIFFLHIRNEMFGKNNWWSWINESRLEKKHEAKGLFM